MCAIVSRTILLNIGRSYPYGNGFTFIRHMDYVIIKIQILSFEFLFSDMNPFEICAGKLCCDIKFF